MYLYEKQTEPSNISFSKNTKIIQNHKQSAHNVVKEHSVIIRDH